MAAPKQPSRLAVVTGASAGIGRATARLFAERGFSVVLVARRKTELQQAAAEMQGRGIAEALDASDGAEVTEMARRVLRQHGTPDVIVNAAGAGAFNFIERTPPEEALDAFKAPFLAAYNLTHAFMPALLARGSGVLLHVGSPASLFAWPGATAYTATRWALRGLNEALNQDLKGTGIKSCHVVFARVKSSYFEHNPGEDTLPALGRTIPEHSCEQAARVLYRVMLHPRREVFAPLTLRLYFWFSQLFPWLVRFLLYRTSPVRRR